VRFVIRIASTDLEYKYRSRLLAKRHDKNVGDLRVAKFRAVSRHGRLIVDGKKLSRQRTSDLILSDVTVFLLRL